MCSSDLIFFNGPWFGLNEKDMFMPGSLLKVPLMLSIFKAAETNPSILDKKINFESGGDQTPVHFPPDFSVKVGEIYSVQALLEAMITYSDNNAALLLSQIAGEKNLEKSYSELGINPPHNELYLMSVRTYASFFRILFNATYLNIDFSEKALSMLTKTKFKDGIHKYIPEETLIAHKFGERELEDGSKQLHDCGIVYYPDKPYVLCVMTRGMNWDNLASIIQNISLQIYEEIKKE